MKSLFSQSIVSESPGEKSVYIMLNGEESELKFISVENFKVGYSR